MRVVVHPELSMPRAFLAPMAMLVLMLSGAAAAAQTTRPADRLPRAGAAERAEGDHRARPHHAQRHRAGLVRRRGQERSARPLRLRAPVRAHDVQGHPRHAGRVHGPADRGRRRHEQRLHPGRHHRVLRGDPRRRPAAADLGRSRADELAGGRQGQLQFRARRWSRRSCASGCSPAPTGGSSTTDLPEDSFAVHPYHRSAIGSIENLDAATLDDLQTFHATYYRPDNADAGGGRQLRPGAARTPGSTSTSAR